MRPKGITYIYSTFHLKSTKYAFFSGAHGTFSWIDQTLGHRTSLNTLNMIKIILSIFSDNNSMKLKINYKKKAGKTQICGN